MGSIELLLMWKTAHIISQDRPSQRQSGEKSERILTQQYPEYGSWEMQRDFTAKRTYKMIIQFFTEADHTLHCQES